MLDEFEGATTYIHQVVFHLTGDYHLLPNQYWFLPGSAATDCLMDLLGENKEDLQLMFFFMICILFQLVWPRCVSDFY